MNRVSGQHRLSYTVFCRLFSHLRSNRRRLSEIEADEEEDIRDVLTMLDKAEKLLRECSPPTHPKVIKMTQNTLIPSPQLAARQSRFRVEQSLCVLRDPLERLSSAAPHPRTSLNHVGSRSIRHVHLDAADTVSASVVSALVAFWVADTQNTLKLLRNRVFSNSTERASTEIAGHNGLRTFGLCSFSLLSIAQFFLSLTQNSLLSTAIEGFINSHRLGISDYETLLVGSATSSRDTKPIEAVLPIVEAAASVDNQILKRMGAGLRNDECWALLAERGRRDYPTATHDLLQTELRHSVNIASDQQRFRASVVLEGTGREYTLQVRDLTFTML
ncbi:hypothetical protein BLNAU_3790 [Blattamonas nauphoetae]|uniref:Uncharacterized protein n=1 Tax=Blattamonas nauphoetae TaxID=2049346 RepID=A0ABQ9YC86_9EUKA|nr:hypothetical protein BLNAU_3790 [Blattamonas nauphoetae]